MSEIEHWLKEVLEAETVPEFEETPETLTILDAMMRQHKEKMQNKKLRESLMKKEIQEYNAEEQRLHQNLAALSLNPDKDLSPSSLQYLRSLKRSASVLGTVQPSHPMLASAMTGFLGTKDKLNLDLLKTELTTTKLERRNSEAVQFRDQIEKKLDDLEASLPLEMKNAETMQKSTNFHIQKKKEYQRQMAECDSALKKSGYNDAISHSVLVRMGEKAEELEEVTKPHRLQLNSFKCLPPNTGRAKLQLQDKVAELKAVEDELHDVLHNIRIVS